MILSGFLGVVAKEAEPAKAAAAVSDGGISAVEWTAAVKVVVSGSFLFYTLKQTGSRCRILSVALAVSVKAVDLFAALSVWW